MNSDIPSGQHHQQSQRDVIQALTNEISKAFEGLFK
jgi:hypothetical protein